MKNLIPFAMAALLYVACSPGEKPAEVTEPEGSPAPSVQLPYQASYSSTVSQDVSDQDLLTVLNSYKAWENGDMAALRGTLADSVTFNAWDGFEYSGLSDGLLQRWSASRDSLSQVKITMHAWTKNHFVDKDSDVITVWYTEVDTYKDGKIDSAYWADVNFLTNGKISWYSQYRQTPK